MRSVTSRPVNERSIGRTRAGDDLFQRGLAHRPNSERASLDRVAQRCERRNKILFQRAVPWREFTDSDKDAKLHRIEEVTAKRP